jgi:hypothetical protein
MNRPITDASQDPRFNTFAKRLFWFKRKKEIDEQFAQRIGTTYSRLEGWKYRNHTPQIHDVIHIADALDVCVTWLVMGHGHRAELMPGNVRATEIPREPIRVYEDVNGGEI